MGELLLRHGLLLRRRPDVPVASDAYKSVIDATAPFKGGWEFNGNLLDRSGNNHHGTLGAGVESHGAGLPADSNQAFSCGGENWVSVAHHADLKPAAGTLLTWFRPTTIPAVGFPGAIASCNTAEFENDDFELRANADGSISCFFQNAGVSTAIVTSTEYYESEQIVVAIVTWDATGIALYLRRVGIDDDIVLIGTSSAHTTGLSSNTLAWRFGMNDAGAVPFDGSIDEIYIWDRVLTDQEKISVAQASELSAPTSPVFFIEDNALPAADVTVNTTPANFAADYSALSLASGVCTHLVLANGSYGAVTLARIKVGVTAYGEGKPIVIRTANGTGRPVASPTSSNSALFSSLTITGDGHVISGVAVQGSGISGGTLVAMRGSNNRLTRSISRNGRYLLSMGNGEDAAGIANPCEDCLIDHCTLEVFGSNAVVFSKANTLRRPIFARIWSRDGRGSPISAGGILVSGWSLNNENKYREQPVAPIIRLCYFGPDLQASHDQAWLHDKVSDTIVAYNRFDRTGFVHDKFNKRFGLRARYIGNYAPEFRIFYYDDSSWFFGNRLNGLVVSAGKSAGYDANGNDIWGVGGFHAVTRSRMSGNSCSITLGNNSSGWLTNTTPTGYNLPDPQPAGVAKPSRTSDGVFYAAFPVGDGLSIRNHSGSITQVPNGSGGFVWAVNLNSQPGAAAPAAWNTDLPQWVRDVCPDPTSLTGGPGGAAPWSIAQVLTRGDAATPNTGPFRNSPGGLP